MAIVVVTLLKLYTPNRKVILMKPAKRRNGVKTLKKQGGWLDITLYIVLAVSSILAVNKAYEAERDLQESISVATGNKNAQVVNAVRSIVAVENTSLVAGTYNGLDWLKDASCGGSAAQAHILCEIGESLPYGLSYTTVVTNAAGVVTATITFGAPTDSDGVQPVIASIIELAMNGASNAFWTPNNQTYYATSVDNTTNVISSVVSNSVANNEFITRDGSAGPTANHDWNNFNLTGIGALSSTSLTTGTIATTGNVTVGGTISGPNAAFSGLLAGNLGVLANTQINGGLNVNGTINSGGNITTSGEVQSATNVRAANALIGGIGVLTNNYAEGGGCFTKFIGTTSNGTFLSCVNGIWVKGTGFSGYQVVTSGVSGCRGTAIAACPAGKFPVGGGGRFISSCGCSESFRFVVENRPLSNTWRFRTECGTSVSYAICGSI